MNKSEVMMLAEMRGASCEFYKDDEGYNHVAFILPEGYVWSNSKIRVIVQEQQSHQSNADFYRQAFKSINIPVIKKED